MSSSSAVSAQWLLAANARNNERRRSAPSLFQLASKAVALNISRIHSIPMPFHVVAKALALVSPEQLARIERNSHFEPGATEALWRSHCSKQPAFCRAKDSSISWRELYAYRQQEIEQKRLRAAERITQLTSRQANDKSSRKIVVVKPPPANKLKRSSSVAITKGSGMLQSLRRAFHRRMQQL